MKKIFLLVGIILIIMYLGNNKYNLTKDSIRFRVIANSNSSKDILMKEKVVSELSGLLFNKSDSIYETRENIIYNLKNIEDRIEILFKNNNYNLNYNISYGMNYFPKKEYKGQVFEEGNYESIVVEIGEAKGNNYFCILYPPLCMIDYENKDNIKYGFKVVDIIKNLF
jgi:stage II sporulation protein R